MERRGGERKVRSINERPGRVSAQLGDIAKRVNRLERGMLSSGVPVEGPARFSARLGDIAKQVNRLELGQVNRQEREVLSPGGVPVEGSARVSARLGDIAKRFNRLERGLLSSGVSVEGPAHLSARLGDIAKHVNHLELGQVSRQEREVLSPGVLPTEGQARVSAQLGDIAKRFNRLERGLLGSGVPLEGSGGVSAQLGAMAEQVNRLERGVLSSGVPVEGSGGVSAQLGAIAKRVNRLERGVLSSGVLPTEGPARLSARLGDIAKQVNRLELGQVNRQEPGVLGSGVLSVEARARPAEQFGDLTSEVRLILETILDERSWKPRELIIKIEPGEVAELGKAKVRQIGQLIKSKEPYQVTEQELERFIRQVLTSVQEGGIETITRAANELVRDQLSAETLRKMPDQMTSHLTEMAERVANRITSTDGRGRSALRRLVLAGALLLAAGASILIPLVAPGPAQIILANMMMVATLTLMVATLIGDRQNPFKM